MHDQELYHHGVKGMKWGVRRYHNSDGSLTETGRLRVKGANRKSSLIKEQLGIDVDISMTLLVVGCKPKDL